MKHEFGGPWTIIKLDVLKKYLEAYAMVFKNQSYFNLIYLDAFAGTGRCDTKIGSFDGSTRIALEIDRFNKYIFIEEDEEKIKELEKLSEEYPNKDIEIVCGNCNKEIEKIIAKYNWKNHRALAFLDPFAMELNFNTLKTISATRAFDIWYLFPYSAVIRNLPNKGVFSNEQKERLRYFFGTIDWENELYTERQQLSLFDNTDLERKHHEEICCFFKKQLNNTFPSVSCPIYFTNERKAPLFLLFFMVSNTSKKAQDIAKGIANYLIDREQTYVCKSPKKLV